MPSKKSNVNNSGFSNNLIPSFKPASRVVDKYSSVVGFSIVLQIFTLIVVTFILNWLNKIKYCKCTDLPERKFLPEWFSFLAVWVIISLGIFIAYSANASAYPTIFSVLSVIIVIINIVMIVRLFIYIRKLRAINCDCGLSQEENIIYYYLIIVFAFIAFSLLMAIIGTLFAITS
jgi:hypothetical protein